MMSVHSNGNPKTPAIRRVLIKDTLRFHLIPHLENNCFEPDFLLRNSQTQCWSDVGKSSQLTPELEEREQALEVDKAAAVGLQGTATEHQAPKGIGSSLELVPQQRVLCA